MLAERPNKTREELIRDALDQALAKGIKLDRVVLFDWTKTIENEGKIYPISCDVTGAVLLFALQRTNTKGWLKEFCDYLKVDGYWVWRFWQGWAGKQIYTDIVDCFTGVEHSEKDKVSELGLKLMKEYIK